MKNVKKIVTALVGLLIIFGLLVASALLWEKYIACIDFAGLGCMAMQGLVFAVTIVITIVWLIALFRGNRLLSIRLYLITFALPVILLAWPYAEAAIGVWGDSRTYYEAIVSGGQSGPSVVYKDKSLIQKYGTGKFVAVYTMERPYMSHIFMTGYNTVMHIQSGRDLSEYHGTGLVGEVIEGRFVKNPQYGTKQNGIDLLYPPALFEFKNGKQEYFVLRSGQLATIPYGIGERYDDTNAADLAKKIDTLLNGPTRTVKIEATRINENPGESLAIKWVYE